MRTSILLLAVLCGGCLDRFETIVVHADGSLDIEHRFEGDGDDLDGGACRIPTRGPWAIRRWKEIQDSGDERFFLSAKARFKRARDVPRQFGDPSDRALRFDTKLVVRDTYYRFERTYEPRTWAPYEYMYRRAFPGELYDVATRGEGIEELTAAQRRKLIGGLLQLTRESLQYWADRAIARVDQGKEHVPDTQLAVRALIATYFERHVKADAFVRALSDDVDRIDALTEALYRDVTELTIDGWAARRGGADPALRQALELERHDYDVTHDLEDEVFVVRLKMPGRVTGHNADRVEGGYLVWEFTGRDLRDRRHRLVATAEVER